MDADFVNLKPGVIERYAWEIGNGGVGGVLRPPPSSVGDADITVDETKANGDDDGEVRSDYGVEHRVDVPFSSDLDLRPPTRNDVSTLAEASSKTAPCKQVMDATLVQNGPSALTDDMALPNEPTLHRSRAWGNCPDKFRLTSDKYKEAADRGRHLSEADRAKLMSENILIQ